MRVKLIADLADFYIEGTEEVIDNYIERYTQIAVNESHRTAEDEKLTPYIYQAVKEAYLRRGDEGMQSSTNGSISTSYTDIETDLREKARSVRILA